MYKLLCVLSLFLTSCVHVNQTFLTPEQAILKKLDSTAALLQQADDGTLRPYCSGVFIEEYLVTAAHCINEGWLPVRVGSFRDYDEDHGTFLSTKTFFPVEIWDVEDVALLIEANAPDWHGQAILAPNDVTYADPITLLGNPRGYLFYFSRGEVVSPRRTEIITDEDHGTVLGEMPYTLVNSTAYPGMSGGPAFNKFGEVVGLVSWGWSFDTWNMVGLVHRESIERIIEYQNSRSL